MTRMSEQLYNTKILRLAASVPHDQRLDMPQFTARKVSPICGSRVTVDLDLDESGKITRFGQEVRACALGQASAAILGRRAKGMDAASLYRAHAHLLAFLKEAQPLPEDLQELEIFLPASPHKARHMSILLAWDAAADAASGRESAAANPGLVSPPQR